MLEVKKLLGKRIAEIRKVKKMQQEELAEIIGIEPNNVSKIETGKNYPTPDNLAKIADALDVDINTLFLFKHHKNYEEIKSELVKIIDSDEKLARMLYKFYLVSKL